MDNGAESSYRRYLDGDESAFEEILKMYYEHLTFFINRYVRNIEEAKDIAIDCFAEIIARPRRFKFQTSFKTYLFSIGRHKAVDYVRRSSRIKFTDEELSETEEEADYITVEDAVISDERKRAVNDAVEGLPKDMRIAVHLVYFEGLSCEEAAKVMKKNRKQIYNLICRAKTELRSILGKEGFQYD